MMRKVAEDEIEEIESAGASPKATRVLLVVLLVIAAAVAGYVFRAPHQGTATPAAATTTRPTPSGPSPAPSVQNRGDAGAFGSVFLEPLAQCIRTDHRQHLRVALAITNLTNRKLRLITATPLDPPTGLQLTRLRYWSSPCGVDVTDTAPPLRPSHEIAVELTFLLSPTCPAGRSVAVRVTFEAGGRRLEADSPTLADLDRVHLVQCPQ
jgi:hypothetical protein